MRTPLTIALACALFSVAPSHADVTDPVTRQKIGAVLRAEHQQKWKAVHWAANGQSAVAQAQREGKPILVFIVVGFRGQQNADHC